jgi:hypothetical protein
LKAARVLVLDKEGACVLEVEQGKADAFIYDQMSVFRHWQKRPETTRAVLAPFQQEAWAVGVRKGNDALRAQVDGFISAFRADGGFERLGEKWLAGEKAGNSAAIVEFEAQDRENERLAAIPFTPGFRHQLTPDDLITTGYNVLLPQPTADFPLENAEGTPLFVDWLRRHCHLNL